MVRLVSGVACCTPIGMQRATNRGLRATAEATTAQRQAAAPSENAGVAVQQVAQQARNRDATKGGRNPGPLLHAETGATVGATADAMAARAWRVTYPNGTAMDVLFYPAATQAEVQAIYPGAMVEPLPDTPTRPATKAEADELAALVAAILTDATEDERAEALPVALADPEAALACYRTLAGER